MLNQPSTCVPARRVWPARVGCSLGRAGPCHTETPSDDTHHVAAATNGNREHNINRHIRAKSALGQQVVQSAFPRFGREARVGGRHREVPAP